MHCTKSNHPEKLSTRLMEIFTPQGPLTAFNQSAEGLEKIHRNEGILLKLLFTPFHGSHDDN